MNLIRSFFIAFSMYSKIPMPRTDWTKESMRYAMCFFPVIGAVIGGLLYLWIYLTGDSTGSLFRAAVASKKTLSDRQCTSFYATGWHFKGPVALRPISVFQIQYLMYSFLP